MFSIQRSSDQEAFADAVATYCKRALGEDAFTRQSKTFSSELWASQLDLGLFDIIASADENAMRFSAVACETFGYFGYPGPIAQMVAGLPVLPGHNGDQTQKIITAGSGPIIAWAQIADEIVVEENGSLYQAVYKEPLGTLGRTHAGHVDLINRLDGSAQDLIDRYNMAMAAFVGGAGRFLVDTAAEHAKTRKQFKKALGEFQAIAFPLSQALIGLDAAKVLTDASALAIDLGSSQKSQLAAAARVSASRAAIAASYAAHQTFGAYGVLDDGPVGWLSRQVREYATLGPSIRASKRMLGLEAARLMDREKWSIAG